MNEQEILPYHVIEPETGRVPILISVPHSGTAFPDNIRDHYDQKLIEAPDDTDWFVHKLYDFAPAMGITMIRAEYSRWVIDLNRDPESAPLYDDGRLITELCPTSTFAGEPIYKDHHMPGRKEIERRLEVYYWPYYNKVSEILKALKSKFGKVLLWDAHSIRQYVPLIRKEVFPDVILGDNNEKTADRLLIETALVSLKNSKLKVEHNYPFKGGHLTRYFGKPEEKQHALQLEMTKINYMDNKEIHYDIDRANIVRKRLKATFDNLIKQLKSL
ncbi:N-formylglutamate deformylase [Fulvivirga imtechensis AK7]|uniref:N-formylglutamate deformylase n=1 Tax=Fulvivirga imtechensis AK7 TaxID=1237149 RepID=L8JQB8_9BACT|nr:N-formylglutamate amidohydrolase [Fulvivirga imtechensis]ELR71050.1 N-formylglutamate deformylase [Fulvivirga imtechensis AK7]